MVSQNLWGVVEWLSQKGRFDFSEVSAGIAFVANIDEIRIPLDLAEGGGGGGDP